MRAVTLKDGELTVDEHPDPAPGAGEVLVRVRAAGLNGADMMQRRGLYPAPPGAPQDIPGLELAGEVAALGAGATRFAEGDRVMAIVARRRSGGARGRPRARADARPRGAGLARGGRLPGGVHDRARRALHPGRARGRASACSCTAPPAASGRRRSSSGAPQARMSSPPSGTRRSGRAWRRSARARSTPEGFEEHGPFDVVLELVGAPNLAAQRRVARDRRPDRRDRRGSRREGGAQPARPDGKARAGSWRRRCARGRSRRRRTTARRVEKHVLPLVESGAVKVPVAETFALDDAAAAYERFAQGGKLGKIVLTT